jgi:hypothetical protein
VRHIQELMAGDGSQADPDPGATRLERHIESVSTVQVVRPREPRAGSVGAHLVHAPVVDRQANTHVVPAVSGIEHPPTHPDRTIAVLEVIVDPTDQVVALMMPTRARVRRRRDRDGAEAGDQHPDQYGDNRPDGA